MRSRPSPFAAIAMSVLALAGAPARAQQPEPVRVLLDAAPRAVEYQLNRLTAEELARVERKPEDPRYRPVYVALLTRKGLGREYFDEALTALTAMDKASPVAVLLQAAAKIDAAEDEGAARLVRLLLAQPVEVLRKGREEFARTAASAAVPAALRAAYGGMLVADGEVTQAWDAAFKREGHLIELLRSIPGLPAAAPVRGKLFEPVSALLGSSQDPATRAAALSALASTRSDAATFKLLAREVQGADDNVRAAAIAALQRLPVSSWPPADVEPLTRAVVATVAKMSPEARTGGAGIEAIALAEKLASSLPAEPGRGLRREIRALGVRIVRIETIPEKMQFDVAWFAVEAGKPVQIVLSNPDAMSHNLVITQPGALKEVATAAASVPIPASPTGKPYVPESPLVLQATRLLSWAETEQLGFTAPAKPGEYPFVCTFPGHWLRMYGVMLVVPDLDAWEAKRTVPTDPMTNRPFAVNPPIPNR